MQQLEVGYSNRVITPSDINEHLPTLRRYASMCSSIVECGVRDIVSSYAFACGIYGKPDCTLTMIDPYASSQVRDFISLCQKANISASFIHDSDIRCPPISTELLFIDTWHVYAQLKRELDHWNTSVSKYIILHDTTVDEWDGETVRQRMDPYKQSLETGFPIEQITKGLWPAVEEFLAAHPEWKLKERYTNNNGLTILERIS